jgi:hypothetical protein
VNGAFLLREGARETVETAPRNLAFATYEKDELELHRARRRNAHAASVE